ncbi:MAG: RraA family protein [Inquilinus sp.]|nr:RraA family protein [Inquilinus sp.]
MTAALPPALLERLRAIDTPTICNGLEIVAPDRRGTGYTTRPLVCLREDMAPIVGYARTATIRARDLPTASAAEERQRRLDYYAYVEKGPLPSIMVIEDRDPEPGHGAFWGEVNTSVHKGLGSLGVITNGSIRDLDQCAAGFQLLAGSVGPSHAYVRVETFDAPVTVAGMAVSPGDLIHADRHGAVVIPAEVAPQLPAAVDLLVRREAVILEASRRGDFDFAALARAIGESDDIH